jgi:hypothetical protein
MIQSLVGNESRQRANETMDDHLEIDEDLV